LIEKYTDTPIVYNSEIYNKIKKKQTKEIGAIESDVCDFTP